MIASWLLAIAFLASSADAQYDVISISQHIKVTTANPIPPKPYAFEPRSSCLLDEKPVPLDMRIVYVPLGYPAVLKCDALELIQKERIPLVPSKCSLDGSVWEPQRPKSSAYVPSAVVWSSTFGKEAASHFVMREDYSLEGYFLQSFHNSSFDCHVLTEQAEYISRINVVIQDCNYDEEFQRFDNRRNPCKYGGCYVDTVVGNYNVTRCSCTEQYIDDFCDTQEKYSVYREVFYYGPVIGHITILTFFFVFSWIRDSMRTSARISLADEVPDTGKPVDDLVLLYPAAYIVPKDAHEEEEHEDIDEFD